MKRVNPILGVWAYAEFGAVIGAFLPIMAVSSLRHRGDPTQRVPGQWLRRLGRTATRLSTLWKFDIEGERPPTSTRPATSSSRTTNRRPTRSCCRSCRGTCAGSRRTSLFKQPLSGWAMRFGGDIPLRRGEGESVRACLAECERALRGGISVMMFPEGTRSPDGDLLPFKDGAFDLAIRTGVHRSCRSRSPAPARCAPSTRAGSARRMRARRSSRRSRPTGMTAARYRDAARSSARGDRGRAPGAARRATAATPTSERRRPANRGEKSCNQSRARVH